LVVKVGGLADEGVHHACIDLCGGGVIDKGDGRAVVEAGEDDDLGVHHRGDESQQFGLEARVVDFKVGLHGLAAEGALGGVLELSHVAGAVDVVEALAVDHHDVPFQDGEVLVGVSVGRQLGEVRHVVLDT